MGKIDNRQLHQMNGDFLYKLKTPLCSEFSNSVKGSINARFAEHRKKINCMVKARDLILIRLSRKQNQFYNEYCTSYARKVQRQECNVDSDPIIKNDKKPKRKDESTNEIAKLVCEIPSLVTTAVPYDEDLQIGKHKTRIRSKVLEVRKGSLPPITKARYKNQNDGVKSFNKPFSSITDQILPHDTVLNHDLKPAENRKSFGKTAKVKFSPPKSYQNGMESGALSKTYENSKVAKLQLTGLKNPDTLYQTKEVRKDNKQADEELQNRIECFFKKISLEDQEKANNILKARYAALQSLKAEEKLEQKSRKESENKFERLMKVYRTTEMIPEGIDKTSVMAYKYCQYVREYKLFAMSKEERHQARLNKLSSWKS